MLDFVICSRCKYVARTGKILASQTFFTDASVRPISSETDFQSTSPFVSYM